MTTKFEYSADIDCSLAALHDAYSTEAYWQDRVSETGGPRDTLDSFEVTDEGVRIVVTQVIPDEQLPDLAKKVLDGQLKIVRASLYRPFDAERISGTADAEAAGGLGTITGAGEAVPTGENTCRESVSGTVRVAVPVLGRKLEKLAVNFMYSLFEKEYAHAAEWVADR